jgi:hypothetical protein
MSWKHHGRAIRLVVMSAMLGLMGRSAPAAAQVPPPPEPALTAPLPPLNTADSSRPPTVANASASEPEALTRGPVHEAYAEPIVFNPTPGPIIPKAPPAAIEEMPPDQKPKGENVAWIPGYWAWDDERDDFLWISGLWRDLPPGRQWMPGYWADADGGHRWVSGYWAAVEQQSANYLTEPPRSLEAGPNVPAPSTHATWTPGYWFYRDTRYVWRPGCWIMAPASWVWIPHHYVWSPCGFVFVAGYWDHALDTRGLLFAPVVMPPVLVAQPAFVFTPAVVIQQTVLVDNLFCRPAWGHYYFGDYYAPAYVQSGFQFAFFYNRSNFGFDPISAHTMAVGVSVGGFSFAAVQQRFDYRVAHIDARPPHRFHDWGPGRPGPGGPPMAMALSDMARSRASIARSRADMVGAVQDANARRFEARTDLMQTRLERIDDTRRTEMARRASELRSFREQRLERERDLSQTRMASFSRPSSVDSGTSQAKWGIPAGRSDGPERQETRATMNRQAPQRDASVARVDMPRSPIASRAAVPSQLPRPGMGARGASPAPAQGPQVRGEASRVAGSARPGPGAERPSLSVPARSSGSQPAPMRSDLAARSMRQDRLESLRERRNERAREARERQPQRDRPRG